MVTGYVLLHLASTLGNERRDGQRGCLTELYTSVRIIHGTDGYYAPNLGFPSHLFPRPAPI